MTSSAPKLIREHEEEEAVCYLCQAPLGEDASVCTACGHRQYRVCYCGAHIRPDLATCPHCQADWSESTRVKARRKSHTHGSVRGLIRSSVTGALTFAAACGFLYFAGGRAAQGMGVQAPPNVLVRLGYLGQAIAFNAGRLVSRVAGFITSGHVLQFLMLLVVGAALGALWYLMKHSQWIRVRLGLQKPHRRHRAV